MSFALTHGTAIYTPDEGDFTFTLKRIEQGKSGELTGLLTITTPWPEGVVRTVGPSHVLRSGAINLRSLPTLESWHKALCVAVNVALDDARVSFRFWLQELATLVEEHLALGVVPLPPTAQPPPPVRVTTMPGGLLVLDTLPMLLCGDGSVGKSTTAAWMSGLLTRAGHKVLFLDFEESHDDFSDKLHRLFPGAVPTVHYVGARGHGALWQQRESLALHIARLGITYLIVDSVAAAVAGSDGPESAAVVAKYFSEVAALGEPLGSLHLAHVTKAVRDDEKKTQKKPSPFGSAFWVNFVRLAYFADTDDEGLSSTRTVAFYPAKRPNRLAASRAPACALAFSYDDTKVNGRITVAPATLTDNAELAQRLSFKARLYAAFAHHPTMSTAEIATALDGDADAAALDRIRAALNRLAKSGQLVNINDGKPGVQARWARIDRAHTTEYHS